MVDAIRDEITSGRWPVGLRIPVESELVAWSGAGRNTVREAVSSLVQAGMLRREQGRGTFVTARSDLGGALSRRAAANPRRDTLELRLALDTVAARLAARRRSDAQAEGLLALLEARRTAWCTGDRADRLAADTALHVAIIIASSNTLLAEVYEGLVAVFADALDADVSGDEDQFSREHRDLVHAIVAGDGEAAGAQMHAILQPLIDALED
ncbi:FCD domain-containing protein [Curtobacterium sp. TC1]|uniref:FadR/GntR family transcriptional regulator n=1 Tax=Curtobacterium sp. TC1 TaxID=2862880 RepID=UPI001C9B4B77|nr:FCD domain-containing protein [Curtobacterium sp. TC1]QZQ55552.1 FCD domain-containing protein [Curtobacterium sp. TC1]